MNDTLPCGDIPDWYLRRRLAVLDLGSDQWRRARPGLLSPGYEPDVCMRRLAEAGRLRRVRRGVYVVVDPVRETAPIAIASALYAGDRYYVTTDAALSYHGLIDQPISTITVVLARRARPVDIGPAIVRPVTLAERRLIEADAFATTIDGFPIRVATREQAVTDALAEPAWMSQGSLLGEVVATLSEDELERTTTQTIGRTTAAAQRLGYLVEDAGRQLPNALASVHPVRSVRLRPGSTARGPYSSRWRVYG
ncbi:MAG: type IV toxin-antitoxin system AbiEi family antitoxin [Chloroflexota bacterium]